MARWLIVVGIMLTGIGLILHYAPWLLSWFGRLPGDIRIESGRSRFYFPITTMIVVSVVLSIVLSLFRR
ncbi:DUF2905 domain-containing protein [Microbulbifer mangrovi]|uniref:DUF2905 domain-containing protein n=1 Tax=Microbulbifer mangrovi TaxID=927787 RepID=UPI0009905AE0|nr:DUF2905 domain-containing protein [Microbulbifer mangrovi]